jgi:hypothetical protein
MSYNGSGTFLINTAGQPVVSGTVISSTAFNALTADLATGLSTAITKDGQTTITANIPMANYKFTGLGVGSAAGDSANLSQVQSTAVKLLASVSGADTITAVGSPNVAAYVAGQMFYFVAAGANTGAVTINIDSLGAKSITRDGTTALAAGDIQSGEVCVIVYDGTQFQLVNGASQSASIVTENLTVNKATVLNESGGDNDTRIEGDTDPNLLFVDASTDRIGVGTSSPAQKLDVNGVSRLNGVLVSTDGTYSSPYVTVGFSGLTNGSTRIFGTTNDSDNLYLAAGTGRGINFWVNGSSADAMLLSSSGNLGLGVTPSANASWVNFQTQRAVLTGGSNDRAELSYNSYRTSGQYTYIASAAASMYQQEAGAHAWFNAASGTAGDPITFTQAMTLDASGNLILGAASGTYKIDATIAASATNVKGLGITNASNASFEVLLKDNVTTINAGGTGNLVFANQATTTERARLTSGGDFLLNAASSNGRLSVETSSAQTTAFFGDLNASTTQNVIAAYTSRAENSAFNFLKALSNGGFDTEFLLRGDGNGYADGTWNNNGADYAEFFESATGAALTLGATVVLDGNKVREATASDPVSSIMGVVRPKEPGKASMMVGNTAWNKWANKYLTDDFDRYIMEDHDVVEWTGEDGRLHSYESHNIPADVTVPNDAVTKTHDDKGNRFQHYKLNPAWNPDADYTPREKRDEWIIVGLVGQVKILKGQPVNDRWIKMRDVSATVEEWMIR